MKKLLSILFVFLWVKGISQITFPQTQLIGGKNTIVRTPGTFGTETGFTFLTNFGDTSLANYPNVAYVSSTPGICIRVNDTLWIRSSDASHWIKQGAGGGGAGTVTGAVNGLQLISSDIGLGGILNQNTTVTGKEGTYNLTLDSLSQFDAFAYGEAGITKSSLLLGDVGSRVQLRIEDISDLRASFLDISLTNALLQVDSVGGSVVTQMGIQIDSAYLIYIGHGAHQISSLTGYSLQARNTSSGAIVDYTGSISSSITNIGTGISIGVDNTGNVKKVSQGYGLSIDSTTTSNSVTFKVDTTQVLPKYAMLGDWYSIGTPNSSPTGWTTFGAYSPTFSGGVILPANGGTTASKFFYTNVNDNNSQNYYQEWYVVPSTLPVTWGDGVYVGSRSENTSVATENAIQFRYGGAGVWRVHVVTGYGGVYTDRDSTATLALTKDSIYKVRATFSRTHIYVEASHINSASGLPDTVGSVSCYTKYPTLATAQEQPRNTGGAWMAGIGTTGQYKVYNFHEYHNDKVNAPVLFIGNSVWARFDASNVPSHAIDMIMQGVTYPYTILAGGGDRFQEGLLDSNYIKALAPTTGEQKFAIIEYGLNGTTADYRTYGIPFFQFLIRNNITPIWLKLFKSTDQDTTFWNIVNQLHLEYVDAHNAIIAPATVDGAHPSDDGFQTIGYVIQGKLSQLLGYTGGYETIAPATTLTVGSTSITGNTSNNILWGNASNVLSQSTNVNYDATGGGLIIGTGSSSGNRLTINNGGISITGFVSHTSGRALDMGAYSGGYSIFRDFTVAGSVYNPMRFGNDALIINGNKTIGVGITSAPAGWVDIAAGTTALSQVHYTSSSLVSTIAAGNSSYNGNYYFSNVSLNQLGFGGVIKDFIADSANTGTSEEFLYRYTTKANSLNADGEKLIMRFTLSLTDGTADKLVKVYFPTGTAIYNSGTLTGAQGIADFTVTIIRTSSTTARATVSCYSGITSGTQLPTSQETDLTGLTFSNAYALVPSVTVSGAGGGAGDATFKMGSIYFYPAANN